jgi:hypothetical protein
LSETTIKQAEAGHVGGRSVHHYAYVERPYEAVWMKLAQAPRQVIGGDEAWSADGALSELHVRRAGVDVSRAVKIKLGGIVAEDEMARMGVRWEDSRHPHLFPVLQGILSLAPVESGRRHVTQVGLVGRYRPPFGALGGIGDRMVGDEVAAEAIAGFVDDVARRLEALVDTEPFGREIAEDLVGADDSEYRRILVPLDGLADRRGGAVGIGRQLRGAPGVLRAQIDPVAGMAEIEYDPDLCSLSRILAELEVDAPPPKPAGGS